VKQAESQYRIRKQYERPIWLDGERSSKKELLRLSAGSLNLGDERQLEFPSLCLRPSDRVAITGNNGCGKSTLLRHIRSELLLPPERTVYLPQEISIARCCSLLEETKTLKGEILGQVMSVVSCLGSRPEQILQSAEPSPGEVRKLLLALGIVQKPHLIVLDEPTNHLDLPSIESLEAALKDCPCALLLVSHDERFLTALTTQQWHIAGSGDDTGNTHLRMNSDTKPCNCSQE